MSASLPTLAAIPEVAAAVFEARTAVDRLLRHRILPSRSAEVSAEAALRGARASASLEGADLPLEAVRALGRRPVGDDECVVAGALRATAEVGALAVVWRRAPLQALARLHLLAAADLVPPEQLGRPVRGGPRLLALADLGAGGGVPAVVEAAVVQGELLALAPFAAANGLVARAAARLVLVARGLDPKALTVPEVGHVAEGDYAARAAAYAGGDVVAWVRHCAAALASGAQESLAVCEALRRGS
jgi:hypothetical protein